MKRTVVQLTLFCGVLLGFVYAVNVGAKMKSPGMDRSILDSLVQSADTSYYFIGSSRVKRSVDPNILKEYYVDKNIYNLGIGGSTFLSNSLIADYIIRKNGPKVLFIELSVLKQSLPKDMYRFLASTDINLSTKLLELTKHYPILDRLQILIHINENQLFSFLSIGNEIKRLFQNNEQHKKDQSWIGYHPLDKQGSIFRTQFLKGDDLKEKAYDRSQYGQYYAIIDHLQDLAEIHHSKIVFFLPTTFKKKSEKAIAVPLFQSLPEEIKVSFSNQMLEGIARKEYLMDMNHYNRQGSIVYSRFFNLQIAAYFERLKKFE